MAIEEHIASKTNPHNLTREQIGLGNIYDLPLASRDDIIGLERDDVYIDSLDTEFVTDAFAYYLYRLGLIAHPDVIKSPPKDILGNASFFKDLAGNFILKGVHPEAKTVDYRVIQDTFEMGAGEVTLSFSNWEVDLNPLNIPNLLNLHAAVYYRSATLYPESRKIVPFREVIENSLVFGFNDVTGNYYVERNHSGLDYVNITITDVNLNEIVLQEDNVAVTDNVNWRNPTTGHVLNTAHNYLVTLKGFIDDVQVLETTTDVKEPFDQLGTLFSDVTPYKYYDFRNIKDTTDVGLYYIDFKGVP